MDNTLRDYSNAADEIHRIMLTNNEFLSQKELNKYLKKLEDYIRQMQAVSYRISTIYTTCQKIAQKRILTPIAKPNSILIKNKPEAHSISVTPPGFDSTPKDPILNSYIHVFKEVAGFNLPVVVLKNEDEIPNTNLYWVSSLQQFALRINGVLLSGNIGQIFNSKDTILGVERCYKGANCQSLNSKAGCKFYHPASDYNFEAEMPSIMAYNWLNSSWLYTHDFLKPNNLQMRHFGNRTSLKNDITTLKKSIKWPELVEKYHAQTMHDILVSLCCQGPH